ncbi:hypothetical protein [Bacillus sp. AK031]
MKKRAAALLMVILTAFEAGCSEEQEEGSQLTIEPHPLSEEENTLISKTGIDGIEYFDLNGKLGEGDDLEYSVDVYKKGLLTDEGASSFGQVEKEFDHALVSFGYNKGEEKVDFFIGSMDGLLETYEEAKGVGAWSFTSLLNEKVSIVKDRSVYLAAWIGTEGSGLRTVGIEEDGSLSDGIEEADLAYVFKVTMTDMREE